jgi:hypothetical protein
MNRCDRNDADPWTELACCCLCYSINSVDHTAVAQERLRMWVVQQVCLASQTLQLLLLLLLSGSFCCCCPCCAMIQLVLSKARPSWCWCSCCWLPDGRCLLFVASAAGADAASSMRTRLVAPVTGSSCASGTAVAHCLCQGVIE